MSELRSFRNLLYFDTESEACCVTIKLPTVMLFYFFFFFFFFFCFFAVFGIFDRMIYIERTDVTLPFFHSQAYRRIQINKQSITL